MLGATTARLGLKPAGSSLGGRHVTGHAVFLPDDPLGSYLSLGTEDQLGARAVMRDLDLRVDVVTLSACTTGLSQVVPGDELLGLLRSWLYAGAATVVSALWDTADIVARLLMERFYVALSQGVLPGIAFRNAVVGIRQLTGREVAAIFAGWRGEDEALAQPGALPEVPVELYDTCPYADAQTWAPFVLIGRP